MSSAPQCYNDEETTLVEVVIRDSNWYGQPRWALPSASPPTTGQYGEHRYTEVADPPYHALHTVACHRYVTHNDVAHTLLTTQPAVVSLINHFAVAFLQTITDVCFTDVRKRGFGKGS